MPLWMRMCLLLAAVTLGGSFTFLGDSFSHAVEPDRYDGGVRTFWIMAGIVLASPMWIPAVLPDRHRRLRDWCRWIGAAVLLLPLVFFGSIVVHNVERWRGGGPPETLLFGLSTTATCVVSILILLWPELEARRARPDSNGRL